MDKNLLIALADASLQAYSDDMTNVIAEFKGNVTRVIVKYHTDGGIIIAFRGTRPGHLSDWILDSSFVMEDLPLKDGKAHSGFKSAYEEISIELNQFLISKGTHSEKYYATGHSLGGAIAHVFAVEQLADVLCTFGQPRTGDREFISKSPKEYLRFVDGDDIVPSVPFGFGYVHGGQEIHLSQQETLEAPIADHDMTKYRSKLNDYIESL